MNITPATNHNNSSTENLSHEEPILFPATTNQIAIPSAQENILTTGGSLWNGYRLYATLKKVEITLNKIQDLREELAHPPDLETPDAHQRCQQQIRAHEEYLWRCRCKVVHCALRVFKASAIVIAHPYVRRGFEGLINTASSTSMLVRERTTQTREQIFSPETTTWKDRAHKAFHTVTALSHFIFGIFTLASSLGYVDDEDPYFKMARIAASTSTISGIMYGGCQFSGLLAERD